MPRFLPLLIVCLLLPQSSLHGQDVVSTTDMERQIFEWTNQERAKVNAPPLKWNHRLSIAARLHSDEMAKHKDLSHQLKDEPIFTERLAEQGAHFNAAAENVGYGEDAEVLHLGWMNSPPHRTNLLNPAYTEMGIGIVRSADRLWATEDFATILQNYSSEDFERAVEDEVTVRRRAHGLAPLKATASTSLRRAACSSDTSAAAALAAVPHGNLQVYAFSFTAPKPDQLPSDFVARTLDLPSGSYLIGACASQRGSNGMTNYRVMTVITH